MSGENEWELALIGEHDYNEDEQYNIPDDVEILPNYVKVEMDVCRLLREDGDKDIAVEVPEDYLYDLEEDEPEDFDDENE